MFFCLTRKQKPGVPFRLCDPGFLFQEMFRKPKRKNVNQRQTLEDDEKCNDIQKPGVPVETGVSSAKVEEVRRVNTSVLTFDQEEEEGGLR